MVLTTAVCLAVWTGMVPAPYEPGFSSAPEETAPLVRVCPPAEAVTAQVTAVPVNVFNGTETPGLAKGVADALAQAGLAVGMVADWHLGSYSGNVLLTTSEAGLANAYTLAQAFTGDVSITLDEVQDPADTTVNVVLGSQYQQGVRAAAEIGQIQADQPITAPEGCLAPTEASGTGGATPSE
ncbi:LytR C-terminal domain-containing protein [Actinomyces sp. 186855]|nr:MULTISPECIES: LytR C-terminal domain-containing protein [unclassified Actinomyces]MCL3778490.1 LytR C-terminal domain-containing protein [Actinomyces sp. AC-20-1]MCL3789686.1 LytR C-terminal domain-containing protein [Actinomyces sp. 187325]MCL3792828.1 LytR C-terminal domain-containing protein [Actinomyces sp. 186855]MCL3795394.1 LytR C-terminal domain-containing protein [Actinomyces sp. 217892]